MKFYHFRQNNSGGIFDVDDKLCASLYIEAENEEDAIQKAFDMGVYFDGVEDGHDCECCGDRWYEPDEEDGIEAVRKSAAEYSRIIWPSPAYRVFFHDGTVEEGPSRDG